MIHLFKYITCRSVLCAGVFILGNGITISNGYSDDLIQAPVIIVDSGSLDSNLQPGLSEVPEDKVIRVFSEAAEELTPTLSEGVEILIETAPLTAGISELPDSNVAFFMTPAPEYDEEKQHHPACRSLKKLNQCFSDFKDKPKKSRLKNIASLKKSLRFMCQRQLAEADWESVLEEFPGLKQRKVVIKHKIKECKVNT